MDVYDEVDRRENNQSEYTVTCQGVGVSSFRALVYDWGSYSLGIVILPHIREPSA